jgi:hypothetical protein
MVKSHINSKVFYNESRELDEVDVDYSAPVYEYNLYGMKIDIVLGKQNHSFSRYDIVYFPIYLVSNEEIVSKIGYFEIESDKLLSVVDDDGDVQINKKGLLFFINKDELQKKANSEETTQEESSSEEKGDIDTIEIISIKEATDKPENEKETEVEELPDVASLVIPPEKMSKSTESADKTLEEGIFMDNKTITILPMLPEETKEQAEKIREEFQESSRNNWIESFRKNNNYKIIDNEGGGDCLFAVIRDAYKQLGKETTVDKLRALVAKEATEDLYQQSRMIYVDALAEVQSHEQEMKKIKKTLDQLKRRIDNSGAKDKDKLLDEAKKMLETYDKLKNQKKLSNELLNEFSYLKGIDSLEKFREFMLTSNYWADTWTISTLERLLNIKMVVLSKQAFESGDVDSVLNCGQLNDKELEERGVFQPDYYIMTSYTGNHYTLVSYKDKRIFKYSELPYDIKIMVVTKCLERNSGPYYLIKDFRNLKTKLGLNENEGEPKKEEDVTKNADIYDDNTVFMFHQNSDNHPKAGKGSGEKTNNLLKFNRLNGIKEWRRKLDDNWLVPITVDGHRWSSVIHYYLGSQFKKGFPDYYLKYSIDSNSNISKDVKKAKTEYNKVVKSKKSELQVGDITIDSDFFTVRENPNFEAERRKALEAKFEQNLDMKQLLLETQDAKLVFFERGKESLPDVLLMRVRNKLNEGTNINIQ